MKSDLSCPSNIDTTGGGGQTEEGLKGLIASNEMKADLVEQQIQLLEDAGNTQSLEFEVETGASQQSLQVYNELMQTAPYISDTVMAAAIENETALPNAMIRDIMVANPHSAKDDDLIGKLDERAEPMPEYMKGQILQGKETVSLKEKLESELAAYKQQKAKAFNRLTRYYISDTLNPQASSDSLVLLYQEENSLEAKYCLAFLYLYRDEYQAGENVLQNVSNTYNLQDDDLAAHENMLSYYNLVNGLGESNSTIFETDSLQVQELYSIEGLQQGKASVYARNILLCLNETVYDEPILLPDILKSTNAISEYQNLVNTKPPKMLDVYPNPSDDYVIIKYNLEIESTGSIIEINNVNGKPVKVINIYGKQNQVVVDTQNWKPGVYIATIKNNGNLKENVKFTIAK